MACEDCEKAGEAGRVAYVRWGRADIGLIGCDTHLRGVLAVLNEHQRGKRESGAADADRDGGGERRGEHMG